MADITPPEKMTDLPLTLVKNIVTLATSGFGLVVALAWNQVIQNLVQKYIDPYLGPDGGMISLFVYAIVITVLAVIVTMQLTTIQRQLEAVQEKIQARNKKEEC
jgi:uncharacterized membrane protein (DUF106 family)